MKMSQKRTLLTLVLISAHTLFAPPTLVNAKLDPVSTLMKTEPSSWEQKNVTDALNALAAAKTQEAKTKFNAISEKWDSELKRRDAVKSTEELRRREKNKPTVAYEATDIQRMPKVIGDILLPIKETQKKDQQNPTGSTARTMPKRFTQAQRAELESIVRGAGLAYELLALDDALAEIIALQPKTEAEKRLEALRLHQEDTSIPLNKAIEQVEDQTEEMEAKNEARKSDEIMRLKNKKYPEIEEQTLSYTRNKALTLTSDTFFKKRNDRSINAEATFKKLLTKAFDTVLKGNSLGEQKEKELDNARNASRYSQSKERAFDVSLADDVIQTSRAIRDLDAAKKLPVEQRLNRAITIQEKTIRDPGLRSLVDKLYEEVSALK